MLRAPGRVSLHESVKVSSMNAKEVRALQDEEIKIELTRLRAKVYELRSETVTEKIKDTSQFGKLKKDIARLLTERRSRSLATVKK